ncbi:hypothetical protein BV22DRAFT_667780 [Leucogyrophana mollusca]|uniref:Uncharacterized protein n=1 Tax=Leucogyrophana mollusca TaxID=85980 RepID=A0ACB8BA09_9AGAM|nr:hypothetical protein BV22DRAFT_667780 [Leucogyrophana mollusca]
MYVGEVLDLYKMGKNRHGSVRSATSVTGLSYLSLRVYLGLGSGMDDAAEARGAVCGSDDEDDDDGADSAVLGFSQQFKSFELHTHAPAAQMLHHLGRKPFAQEIGAHYYLNDEATDACISTTFRQEDCAHH